MVAGFICYSAWFPLEIRRLLPALWADARINRRALFEHSELARLPYHRVRPF